MSKVTVIIITVVVILGLSLGAILLRTPASPSSAQARIAGLLQPRMGGFERVYEPRPLVFPADHGAHPEFQTEWWYYTGNLEASGGQHFGFELTFFRRALQPPDQHQVRSSSWATEQVYMAHFAITDASGQKFQAFERLERGAAGLAGAQGEPVLRVWLDNWSVEQVGPKDYHLQAAGNGLSTDLKLTDVKGPILQGDHGYSQKGSEPGNASYYYSQTRLDSSGTLSVDGKEYTVTGLSWMDHEFSTSALAPQLVGWDWFALQLSNGDELMMYNLRNQDGSVDPFSSGTMVAPDGSTRRLAHSNFTITPTGSWRSPHSGAVYPSGWAVEIPGTGVRLTLLPYLADQELDLSFIYWEGAVKVTGSWSGATITGSGYVELTGYTRTMQGQL
jgi:predicted secreted hydrolase